MRTGWYVRGMVCVPRLVVSSTHACRCKRSVLTSHIRLGAWQLRTMRGWVRWPTASFLVVLADRMAQRGPGVSEDVKKLTTSSEDLVFPFCVLSWASNTIARGTLA